MDHLRRPDAAREQSCPCRSRTRFYFNFCHKILHATLQGAISEKDKVQYAISKLRVPFASGSKWVCMKPLIWKCLPHTASFSCKSNSYSYRVHTLMTCQNSMTFHDFCHDLFSAVNKFWSRRSHWESRRQATFRVPNAKAWDLVLWKCPGCSTTLRSHSICFNFLYFHWKVKPI